MIVIKDRPWWKWALLLAALGFGVAALGFGVAASGVIPIKASSGHWAITEWMLHFSMRRSIATHTLGQELPALDDPELVLKGAGHFEAGCRPCHGSPALREPRVPAAMLPPPPDLTHSAEAWEPQELFYIIKHGIKFTGMPAWPTQQRDDEIVAVVAFLQALPGLDAARYRALVHGPSESPPAAAMDELVGRAPDASESCVRCHGRTGQGRENGAFPRLAHQREGYLVAALDAYANGARHSGIMQPVAAALDPQERRALAAHYARQAGAARIAGGPLDAERSQRIARGRDIATRGVPGQRVPACAECHGPRPERHNPRYPRLAGQHVSYLVLQLELFQRAQRGGSPQHHLMHKAAPALKAQQLRDVAEFYASLDSRETDELSAR